MVRMTDSWLVSPSPLVMSHTSVRPCIMAMSSTSGSSLGRVCVGPMMCRSGRLSAMSVSFLPSMLS